MPNSGLPLVGVQALRSASRPRRALRVLPLSASLIALAAGSFGCGGSGGTTGPPSTQPSLASLVGTCAVERFEQWSILQPVTVLYDAAAYGYVATLTITRTSTTSGTFAFRSTSRDLLNVTDDDSGTLTLVGIDSLRFTGEEALPNLTHFSLVGSVLTLTNPNPHQITLAPGPYQVTTRIVCRRSTS